MCYIRYCIDCTAVKCEENIVFQEFTCSEPYKKDMLFAKEQNLGLLLAEIKHNSPTSYHGRTKI